MMKVIVTQFNLICNLWDLRLPHTFVFRFHFLLRHFISVLGNQRVYFGIYEYILKV